MRRRARSSIVTATMAAALAAMIGGGCDGNGVNHTECLARANEILKESLRHDRSDVRALALEAYRDLNRVAPAEELEVILARDLVPTRFEAAMARAEQARRTSLRMALLSAMRDQGSSPGGRNEPFRQAETVVPRALDSRSPVLRTVALDVLRDVQSRLNREPGASLKELLTDPRTPSILATLLTEAERNRQQDRTLLLGLMQKESDANVRLALAYGLARTGDDRYMPLLASGLAGKEPSLRRNAALILGLLGNRSAADMLYERLTDGDLVARLSAAEAMARLGDTRGLPVIRNLALGRTPAEPWIQTSAILALGRVGIPLQDIDDLRLLGAKGTPVDGSVRLAAWGARGMLGDYSQMSILAECASGRAELDTQGRAMALQLLAQVSYGPAWRDACHSLSASDVTVRLSAAWAVLAFGNPRAEKVIDAIEKSSTPQRLTEEDILRPYRAPAPATGTPGAANPQGPLGPGGAVAPLSR